jgi:hypothetical protein
LIKAIQTIQSSNWANNLLPERDGQIMVGLNKEDIPNFNRMLAASGVDIYSLQARHSLEDYFLQVTAGKQHVGTFTN